MLSGSFGLGEPHLLLLGKILHLFKSLKMRLIIGHLGAMRPLKMIYTLPFCESYCTGPTKGNPWTPTPVVQGPTWKIIQADLRRHPNSCASLEKLKKKKVLNSCPKLSLREEGSCKPRLPDTNKADLQKSPSGNNKTLLSNWGGRGRESSFTVITKAERYLGINQIFKFLWRQLQNIMKNIKEDAKQRRDILHSQRVNSISKSVFTRLLLKLNIIPIKLSVGFVWVCGILQAYPKIPGERKIKQTTTTTPKYLGYV